MLNRAGFPEAVSLSHAAMAGSSSMAVPEFSSSRIFQRRWVWDEDRIKSLIASHAVRAEIAFGDALNGLRVQRINFATEDAQQPTRL
jgi:hypothetical protein